MRTYNLSTPPTRTRWIDTNADLPQNYGKAKFKITKPSGETFTLILDKRKRQTIEALMLGPIYAASRIRIGEYVSNLRHDNGISILTDWYKGTSGPIKTTFGTYTLNDQVECLGEAS